MEYVSSYGTPCSEITCEVQFESRRCNLRFSFKSGRCGSKIGPHSQSGHPHAAQWRTNADGRRRAPEGVFPSETDVRHDHSCGPDRFSSRSARKTLA